MLREVERQTEKMRKGEGQRNRFIASKIREEQVQQTKFNSKTKRKRRGRVEREIKAVSW
jgi:hypothetical protein